MKNSASSAEAPDEQHQLWLAAAIDAARLAAARAYDFFLKRDALIVMQKGPRDYVTLADQETEILIVNTLRARFPDHAFLGEESAAPDTDVPRRPGQPTWVIDPIDGTSNFIRGIPLWAVSIGLVVDGVPEVGVIACPCQDELYTSARGAGAMLNMKPIRASTRTDLSEAQVVLGSPRRLAPMNMAALGERLVRSGSDMRRIGSACVAIAWTACGRIDGYVENGLSSWDIAAGLCLLAEAGARHNDIYAPASHADDATTKPRSGCVEDSSIQHADAWMRQRTPLCCAAPGLFDALTALCTPPAGVVPPGASPGTTVGPTAESPRMNRPEST